jgi:peptide/nickel transport system substrate-binding protein
MCCSPQLLNKIVPSNPWGWLRDIVSFPKRLIGHLINKIKSPKKNSASKASELDRKLILNLKKSRIPSWEQLKHVNKVLSKKERLIIGICAAIFCAALFTMAGAYYFEHRIFVPRNGGEYIEGLVGAPQFINPLYSLSNDVDMDISRLVFSGLMRVTPEGNIEPDLAESYEVSEDGKTYTFHIRGDARWHDGDQVTADDILFTFDSILNPNLSSPWAVSFRGVEIEKIDDLTIRFILEDAFSPFLSTLTVGILPAHLWQDIPTTGFQLTEFNRKPIGSGPYKFKSFTKDKKGMIHSYSLERNDNYYAKAPYIEKIIFKFYPTFEEGVNALNNKNVQGLSYLPSESRDKIRGRSDLVYHEPSMPQYTGLFFNQKKRSELKDIEFRQALAYANDKEAIVNNVLRNKAAAIHAPILEGYVGYHPEIEKFEFNPQKAEELLDETDWTYLSEGDTFRAIMTEAENEEGETVETRQDFTLTITTIDTAENIAVAEALRDQWEKVGIKVEVLTYSTSQLQREIIKNYDFEILLFGEILGVDPDPFPFWHSSQIDSGLNLAQLANRDIDALLEDARTTVDPEVRQEKYKKFQDIIAEKLPAIFLYSPTYTYPVTKKVKGVNIERMAIPSHRFSGITDWYIKTKRAWK